MGILDRKKPTNETTTVPPTTERKEDTETGPTITTTSNDQLNEAQVQAQVRRKVAEARRKLFDAKSRLSLKELEMMKEYTMYFPGEDQDFTVEEKKGEHGSYGQILLKYQDVTAGANQTEMKELLLIGDYYIDKFLKAIEEGNYMLKVKKVEWKGQGNRKFDVEVLPA